jgi:Uma2 family endonuclease
MSLARRTPTPPLDAEAFLTMDQTEFGPAWRYELVDGQPVAQAAPSPDHAAIIANLSAAVAEALRGIPSCRGEAGSGVVPRRKPADRARIPDFTIRYSGKPVILFEVLSPSDSFGRRSYHERMQDLMNVEGAEEIIEIAQNDYVLRRYRRDQERWIILPPLIGAEATLPLESIGITLPVAALYEKVLVVEPQTDSG